VDLQFFCRQCRFWNITEAHVSVIAGLGGAADRDRESGDWNVYSCGRSYLLDVFSDCVCVGVGVSDLGGQFRPPLGAKTGYARSTVLKLMKMIQQDKWFGDCIIGLSKEEREGV
jgi:hypothetical protein